MSRGDVDNKVVRQQARKIRLISKGLVKGSRYGLSNFVLLNSAQTLVVTGHQCKVVAFVRQGNLTPSCPCTRVASSVFNVVRSTL